MSSSDAQQIEELEQVKGEMKTKSEKFETELEGVNAKMEKLENELRELKKDHHQQLSNLVNRHQVNGRRRNLPAELRVEIVDCLPLENAVHFLANVPNRLIIHHCAPRIRRILGMIRQIVTGYARVIPRANSFGNIRLENRHKYTPEIDIFLHYGAAHCRSFYIWRGNSDSYGFVGYPANFFNDLIKHYYETKVLTKAICHVCIILPLENPAPWPTTLMETGEMKLWKWKVRSASKYVEYILRNKHNPDIAFTLWIYFQEGAECYKQMTGFEVLMMDAQ